MSVVHNNIFDIKPVPIHTLQFSKASTGIDYTFKYLQSGSTVKISTIKSARKDENGRNRIVALVIEASIILLNTNYQELLDDGTIRALTEQDLSTLDFYFGGDGTEGSEGTMYGRILSVRFNRDINFKSIESDFEIDLSELKPKATLRFKTILSTDMIASTAIKAEKLIQQSD